VTVAVAIGMDGFSTLSELVPALAFHAVSSALGWQLLTKSAAEPYEEPAEETLTSTLA
jgi:hypothetical protein